MWKHIFLLQKTFLGFLLHVSFVLHLCNFLVWFRRCLTGPGEHHCRIGGREVGADDAPRSIHQSMLINNHGVVVGRRCGQDEVRRIELIEVVGQIFFNAFVRVVDIERAHLIDVSKTVYYRKSWQFTNSFIEVLIVNFKICNFSFKF